MLIAGLRRRSTWSMVYTSFACGVLLGGCVPPDRPQPTLPVSDVSKRLTALEACIIRSQQIVARAADAGMSGGPLAPANSSIADAQDAFEVAHALLQQQQVQEAEARAVQGLEVCESVAQIVAKACQGVAERKEQTRLSSAAEAQFADMAACVETARPLVERARAAPVQTADTQAATQALQQAEVALEQAREALARNDPRNALGRLEAVKTDCQMAQTAGAKALASPSPGAPGAPARRRW